VELLGLLSSLDIMWTFLACCPHWILCGTSWPSVLTAYYVELLGLLSSLFSIWNFLACCPHWILCGTSWPAVLTEYYVELLGLLSSLNIMWSFLACCPHWIAYGTSWPAVLTTYFPNDQFKETEVDHIARTEKEGFDVGLGGIWGKGATWNLGAYLSGMLKWIIKKQDGCLDWTDLAHDRYKWRSVSNTSMNLRVIQNSDNFLSRWETVSFLIGICSMKFYLLFSQPVQIRENTSNLPSKFFFNNSPILYRLNILPSTLYSRRSY
jgi:hypothetical protein